MSNVTSIQQSIGKSGNNHLSSITLTISLHSSHLRSLIQTHTRSFNDFYPPFPPYSSFHDFKRSIHAHIPNAPKPSICIIYPSTHLHSISTLHPQYLHETRKKERNGLYVTLSKVSHFLAPFVCSIFLLFYYSFQPPCFWSIIIIKVVYTTTLHYHPIITSTTTHAPLLHCVLNLF